MMMMMMMMTTTKMMMIRNTTKITMPKEPDLIAYYIFVMYYSALISVACCAESLEFPEWKFSVDSQAHWRFIPFLNESCISLLACSRSDLSCRIYCYSRQYICC